MTTDTITTTSLSDFGFLELKQLEALIRAYREQGLPDDFWNEDVTPMFNKNSGVVFLTNSEYQVAMLNGDTLESWHNCPECGHEGFAEDMPHEGNEECTLYLKDLLVSP